MNVLVLDDDEALRFAICDILRQRDFHVDHAASAVAAIDLVASNHYDLILVDYVMPDHDGVWFMKNAKMPRATKVLLMTGHLERSVINKMFDLGASGYIIKPFNEDELLHHLDFFLHGRTNDESDSMSASP